MGIAGNTLGGPVGALVATVVATELGKLVSKETRLDIVVTPGVTIIFGVLTAQCVGPTVARFMDWFGTVVKTATEMQPFFMGILVSALIGVALTLPISKMCIRDRPHIGRHGGNAHNPSNIPGFLQVRITPVSYTHLDVYKRQAPAGIPGT